MKIVKLEDTTLIKNSNTSKLTEYSILLNDKNIDCGVNEIKGRYPEKGYCTNKVCKELCYILEGNGKLYKKDEIEKDNI